MSESAELRLVDNETEERTVATALKKHLGAAGGLDVATGFFEVGGLLALEGVWQQAGSIRILLGAVVGKRSRQLLDKHLREKLEQEFLDGLKRQRNKDFMLRGLLEIAFRDLTQMEARVEADEAKAELTRLGFGLSTLDTSGGAGGKSGGGGGDKDSRRASLGLSALFGGGKTASLRSSTKSPANVGDSSSLRENSIKTLDLGKARAMSPANGEVVPPDAEDYNA